MLVSKDVNLRMKAKALGLMAQDYRNDHVKDIASMYTGIRLKEHVDVDLTEQPARPGDVLLLCSDGLSGLVHVEMIRDVLMTIPDPRDAAAAEAPKVKF